MSEYSSWVNLKCNSEHLQMQNPVSAVCSAETRAIEEEKRQKVTEKAKSKFSERGGVLFKTKW
jgi:hypothetical protein